jgi:hypothetical protein
VILLAAIALGLAAGLGLSHLYRQSYQPPNLRHLWLVFIAFLPQYIVLYIPSVRDGVSDVWAGILLTASQLALLGFAWLNRKLPGMRILLLGAVLNFTVMAANRGFMPISPQTAARLIPQSVVMDIPVGSRFGIKDILLHPEDTRFEWLADRFAPPAWFPYQVAFSLGDVFLAVGVFRLLASQPALSHSTSTSAKRIPI